MFTVDPNITDLQVKEKVIAKAFFSMNSPEIATPELSVEEARCYILFFRAGNSYSAYIGLYLPKSERKFFYVHSENTLPEEKLKDALDEAMRFAEEMGFLLDELKLASMSVDERNAWIEDQAIFGFRKQAEVKPEEKPQAEAAVKEDEKPAEKTAERPEAKRDDKLEARSQEQPPAPAERPADAGSQQPPAPDREGSPPRGPEPLRDIPRAAEEPPAAEPVPAAEAARPKQSAPAPQPSSASGAAAEEGETVQPEPIAPAAKAQKTRARKTPQSPTGTVRREYEALAHLLASF